MTMPDVAPAVPLCAVCGRPAQIRYSVSLGLASLTNKRWRCALGTMQACRRCAAAEGAQLPQWNAPLAQECHDA